MTGIWPSECHSLVPISGIRMARILVETVFKVSGPKFRFSKHEKNAEKVPKAQKFPF